MIHSRSCYVGPKKACKDSKYANRRGAKSAKRVLRGPLSLLAPHHFRVLEKHRTICPTRVSGWRTTRE
jgi:hypothetical protein